jgi:hypothetical protein
MGDYLPEISIIYYQPAGDLTTSKAKLKPGWCWWKTAQQRIYRVESGGDARAGSMGKAIEAAMGSAL